jgi:osmotically-inducible protein OsmY
MRALGAFVLGLGAAYYLDPQSGTGRRQRHLDQLARAGRSVGRLSRKKGRHGVGKLHGVEARIEGAVREPTRDMDDATVLQRIKSDALRDVGLSPSDIEVGVHDGIATLEGTVETSQLADDLVARVRDIPGVESVDARVRVALHGSRGDGEDADEVRLT